MYWVRMKSHPLRRIWVRRHVLPFLFSFFGKPPFKLDIDLVMINVKIVFTGRSAPHRQKFATRIRSDEATHTQRDHQRLVAAGY